MRTRIRTALIVFALAAGAVICWQVLRPREREPLAQGKPLSTWLWRIAHGEDGAEGTNAVRRLGTNGIPTLLHMLCKSDSSLVSGLDELWGDLAAIHALPAGVRYPSWYRNQAFEQNRDALLGFEILGSQAQPAVPALVRVFEQNPSEQVRYLAIQSLAAIGPAAREAIPAFLRAAASPNARRRGLGTYALGQVRADPGLSVPVLVSSLADTDVVVRGWATLGLAKYGTNAESAVPRLLSLLKDPVKDIRGFATNTLRTIDPQAATRAGVR